MTGVRLREAVDADADALEALAADSPDTGAVAFSVQLHVAAHLAHSDLRERRCTVVAQMPDRRVVGSGTLGVGTCRVNGEERPYALLSGLQVHPAHRRQGIAAALTRWRIDRAREVAGRDVVVVANIQRGNAASLANARRWATWTSPPALTAPIPMRRRPPRPAPGMTFRPASVDDLDLVAAELERCNGRDTFTRPWPAADLQQWVAASPFDTPVNHLLVAVDDRGRLVAGMGVREQGRVQSYRIDSVPPGIRAANTVLRVIPADRVLRNLSVDKVWFAPGRVDALRALWEHTRWTWRERGSNLLVTADRRSPTLPAYGLRPWSPTTQVTVAACSPVPLQDTALVDPLL